MVKTGRREDRHDSIAIVQARADTVPTKVIGWGEGQWTDGRDFEETESKEGKAMNLFCQISMLKAYNVHLVQCPTYSKHWRHIC